jgi:hypothetical protein
MACHTASKFCTIYGSTRCVLEYENRLAQVVQGLLEEQGMTGHFARWEGLVKSHGSHSEACQLLPEIEYDISVNWFRDETVKSN